MQIAILKKTSLSAMNSILDHCYIHVFTVRAGRIIVKEFF